MKKKRLKDILGDIIDDYMGIGDYGDYEYANGFYEGQFMLASFIMREFFDESA